MSTPDLEPIVDSKNEAPASPKSKPNSQPLTPKRAARRSALKAQLTDPVVVPEDPKSLQLAGMDAWQAFKPRNAWHSWLAQQVALTTFRIDRSQRIERRLRDWISFRAIDFWEDDQRLAAEILGSKIGVNPSKVLAELRTTPSGCDWLIVRWRALAQVDFAQWTDEQRGLARSMVVDGSIDLATPGLAQGRVAELLDQRGRVEEADEILRRLVEADLSDESNPSLTRLRRYERSLHRNLKWFLSQLQAESPDRWDDPRYRPAYLPPWTEPVVANPTPEGVGSASEKNETNPTLDAPIEKSPPKKNETNPFRWVETGRPSEEFLSEIVVGKGLENDRARDRKRRIDPAEAVARDRKAGRRSA